MSPWNDLIPENLSAKFEFYNYNHAVEILERSYPVEFDDLVSSLDRFTISQNDLIIGGGNESEIPKKLSNLLHPLDWKEVKISGDLIVKLHRRNPTVTEEHIIENFIDGHNIDYVKGKIAIDMEWNSKDQTFDRDLYAFRTFYECGIIDCGVIITRSASLNPIFDHLRILPKYGASTTWMGKLLPRINARRHGGCPLLVVGITPAVISDLEVNE
jgi:CRISPR-associated protein Csd2